MIKGLLAAIGVILILKQIPHVLGIDLDPEGDMAFQQPDNQNTLSELGKVFERIQPGAAILGLLSIAVLVVWTRWKLLKQTPIPVALVVVLLGFGTNLLFRSLGEPWNLGPSHLVQVPVANSMAEVFQLLQDSRFRAVVESCRVHRSGDDRRRGVAGDAPEPGPRPIGSTRSSAPRPRAANWWPRASAILSSG